jgi:hypothetical protein
MALQAEAIESRLEGLKQDDRRITFDSKLRAFQHDSKAPLLPGNPASKMMRKSAADYPVDQMISLLEELSRRIDGLERKDRALAEEIRHRARRDQVRRSVVTAGGLAFAMIFAACWLLHWI